MSSRARSILESLLVDTYQMGDEGAAAINNSQSLTKSDHFYRGMTAVEYNNTVGAGKGVLSNNRYSLPGEGTSFASDFDTALSYASVGRDDPRKTGTPVYIVEITGSDDVKPNRQGYFYVYGEVPRERISKVYKIVGRDNCLWVESRTKQLLEQLEMAGTVRVSVNPSRYSRLCSDLGVTDIPQSNKDELRVLANVDTLDVYIWSAFDLIHHAMARQLGVDYFRCAIGYVSRMGSDWVVSLEPDAGVNGHNSLLKDSPNFNAVKTKVEAIFS